MPYHWTSFYVKAFRERCDVVSVGPKPDESLLKEGWRSGAHDAVVPPDIEVDFVGPWDLYDLLPAGWQPDLVVGISGMGGRDLY